MAQAAAAAAAAALLSLRTVLGKRHTLYAALRICLRARICEAWQLTLTYALAYASPASTRQRDYRASSSLSWPLFVCFVTRARNMRRYAFAARRICWRAAKPDISRACAACCYRGKRQRRVINDVTSRLGRNGLRHQHALPRGALATARDISREQAT